VSLKDGKPQLDNVLDEFVESDAEIFQIIADCLQNKQFGNFLFFLILKDGCTFASVTLQQTLLETGEKKSGTLLVGDIKNCNDCLLEIIDDLNHNKVCFCFNQLFEALQES
jgi:hypothetical protein